MELTPEQQNAIARLYENESLTENLNDQEARALLEWAQGQIAANTDDSLVRAAVSAANSSGEQGVQALVTEASTFLARELAVSADAATRSNESPGAMTMCDSTPSAAAQSNESAPSMTMSDAVAPTPTEASSDELMGRAASDNPAELQASGSAAEQNTLSASSGANIGTATPSTTIPSKPKRKRSRKSKGSKKN